MAIKVWTGNLSSDPSVPNNWLGEVAPVSGDKLVFNHHATRAVSGSFSSTSARIFSIVLSHTYPFAFGTGSSPLQFSNVDIPVFTHHNRYDVYISGVNGSPVTIHSLKIISPAVTVLDYANFANGSIRFQSGSETLEGSFSGAVHLTNVVVTDPEDRFTVSSDYNTGGSFTLIPAISNPVGPSLSLDIRGRDWEFNIPDGLALTAPIWPGVSHIQLGATLRPSSYNEFDSVKLNYLKEGSNSVLTAITLNTYSHSFSAAIFETASHMSIDEDPSAKINLYGGTFRMPNTKLKDNSTASHQVSGVTLDGPSLLDLRVGSELEILTIPILKVKDPSLSHIIFNSNSVVSVAY